jgi:hypothetical protein
MRPSAFLAVGLVALLVLLGAGGVDATPAATHSAAGAGDSSLRAVLPTYAPPNASAAARVEIAPGFSPTVDRPLLGSANASGPLDVTVGLAGRDAGGLADYLVELYSPGSPLYHHYLGPAQLASRYGAAPGTISSASSYFRSFGLAVAASPDGLLLDVSGTSAAVGDAFHTSFDRYGTGPTSWVVSHPTPAELPASIAWSGALGLGNATALVPASTGPLVTGAVVGPDASCPTGSPYAPCEVWGAYDLGDLISNGTDGKGLTIGVVDTYDGQESQTQLATDVADFDSDFDLPAPPLHFLYPVATTTDLNATNNEWAFEEALDLEWAHASAPGAAIDMAFSPNSGVGLYEAVDYLVSHDLVNVLSLSWGEPDVGIYNAYQGPCNSACNASTDGSYDILSPVLEFAAAEGISVFAATGDCGASDGTSGVATNYPASDPYVTAVGGTDLVVSGSDGWGSESGWSGNSTGASSPGCYNQGGSGGGYSPLPRPYWQSGPGLSAGSTRATPDVSAVASPGVQVVEHAAVYSVEGTSVATPIWAGIAAVAGQASGAPLGFLNPALYSVLRSGGYSTDFHDITTGNNGYSAGPGWDPVTGIGSPVVGALIPALSRTSVAPSTLAVDLNASTTGGAAPLDVTFFENATGGSGTYPIQGFYFGDGTAAPSVDGEGTHVYATPGVYAAQSYAWDSSGNVAQSIPLAIVVGGGSTLSVALNATNRTPAVAQSVTFYANASGGIGPYTYDFSFGDGTFLNGTSSTAVTHSYLASDGYCAVAIVEDSATPADGGESAPVAVSVGGAPAPDCAIDRGARTLSVVPDVTARDAPADFPPLFRVSGGVGSYSEQLVSSDPYVAACDCAIFRAPGTFSVNVFVNSTGAAPLSASTTVVVSPTLQASYEVSSTTGLAPLTVNLQALVTGGTGTNTTWWNATDGSAGSGPIAAFDFPTPGEFWVVAHTEDGGDGNASEAFLVDVLAVPGTGLAATVEPAVDIASGATVTFTASTIDASVSAAFAWTLGDGATAYTATAQRTYYAPANGGGGPNLTGSVRATLRTGAVVSAEFDLHPFFAVEPNGLIPATDALSMTDVPGADSGVPPLGWTGVATVSGPGALNVNWTFGDGARSSGSTGSTTFDRVGEFTVTVEATDSFGDTAWDVHGVSVATSPIILTATATPNGAAAPVTVELRANATGGGPPYSYTWSLPGASPAHSAETNYTFLNTGDFNATVTVTDTYGQQANSTLSINVTAPPGPGPRPLGPIPLVAIVLGVGTATAVVLAVIGGRRRPPATP